MNSKSSAAPTADEQTEANLNALVQKGIEIHQKGRLDEAEAIYDEVLEQDPLNASALHFAGLLQFHRGRCDEAERLLGRSIAFNPEYADAYNNLGNVLRHQKKLVEASACYQRASKIDEKHANALRNLGLVNREIGNLDIAQAALQRYVELNPDCPNGREDLAILLFDSGLYGESIPHFEQAMRLKPGRGIRYNLGMAYYGAGKVEKARDVFSAWYREDPEDAVARHMAASFSVGDDVPDQAHVEYVRMLFDDFSENFDNILTEKLDYDVPNLIAGAVASRYRDAGPTLNILDVGCGTGLCAEGLKPYASMLVGMDLSRGMLEQAQELDLYDELVMAELTDFFDRREYTFDLIASGDTLCYLGDLQDAVAGARQNLAEDGRFIFSVEHSQESTPDGYLLQMNGRYKHSQPYIERLLSTTGFQLEAMDRVTLRLEQGKPVAGLIVVAKAATTGE